MRRALVYPEMPDESFAESGGARGVVRVVARRVARVHVRRIGPVEHHMDVIGLGGPGARNARAIRVAVLVAVALQPAARLHVGLGLEAAQRNYHRH